MTEYRHPRRHAQGFTLIELMVTISVLAILLAMAAPSFSNALLGSKLGSYANRIVASANLARSEAIKRNVSVSLCVSTDGATCAATGGWESGWLVGCPTDDDATCNAAGADWLVLHREQAVAAGLKISEAGSAVSIAFQPDGVGATSSSLTVCRATPSAGAQERVVTITATGRASVEKTNIGTCV